MTTHALFTLLDLIGTFAFAISGAVAAHQKKLDLFGVISLAYVTACGGGIIRDICIGAIPPAGLSDWRYLVVAVIAAGLVISMNALVRRLSHPVLLFDAAGLSFFAVFGAHKTLQFGHGIGAAIILGTVSAVGGGVMRDLFLNRTPVILQKEIYASAALFAAAFLAIAEEVGWSLQWVPWTAIALCFAIRYLSLRFNWNLPRFSDDKAERG
ncbi:trimeric intracellular cation channel family protein [Allopusillimonas soli]|uniref:Trimeric intracellular cation channel family protein n=1 Tax=Allopusillimonas soli TaxID=659016 RepID=A0A853F4F0_9BURK|nr:trimeric intracellular cation channel family protein [Allopusillimonas soli]NYT35355.1 trimeric intracellular cation channel family protein [Allopusillimonas soli]TEA75775.1 trimeric intracellular cation channel family protein [Allopusillimonas soli]